MQATSEPYFVFVDSDNQPMVYAGDIRANVNTEQSLLDSGGSVRPDEIDSNSCIDRLTHENGDGDGFLQSDPFQLSDNSATVLSCLPQCEQELLHSATLGTLSAELEMDVSDSLELRDDDGVAVEPSSSPESDEDHSLLADVDAEKISAESHASSEAVDEQERLSTLDADSEQLKNSDSPTSETSDKPELWPMATQLANGRLQCNVCRKELRIGNYNPHMRRVHKLPASRSRPIAWKVCDRCGYQCQDNYKLRRHVMTHTRYG